MKIPEKKNWGSTIYEKNRELTRQLDDMYSDVARAVNRSVKVYSTTGNPPPATGQFNRDFEIGDEYIRTDTNQVWKLTSRTTQESVTWTLIS